MVSINDHPDIRVVFEGFAMDELSIAYSTSNARTTARKSSGELVIKNY